MPDANDKRSYRLALVLVAVGGVLLLVGFGLPWASAQLPLATGVDTATRTREFTGLSLYPGAAACGWVCLAGVAGILATRSWGRAIVGAIVVLAGGVAAAVAVAFAIAPSSAIDSAAQSTVGSPVSVAGSATGWWALSLLGAVLAAAAGAWTMVRGRRWPAMGARYERAPRRAAAVSQWDAMDKGVDPTDDLIE